jgi:phosphinothricin acetyltransferase
MQALSIRDVLDADLASVTSIYGDAVRNGTATYELEVPTVAEMTARRDAMLAYGYPYLVAERDGVVIGYAYAGPFRARPAYRFIVENSVYIAPEAKGAGVGKALMRALIARCEQLGFRQVVAVIGDGGPASASVRLHESLGFSHSGVLEGSGYKHERWLDTVFMQLPLNGGNGRAPDADSLPERNFRAGNSG